MAAAPAARGSVRAPADPSQSRGVRFQLGLAGGEGGARPEGDRFSTYTGICATEVDERLSRPMRLRHNSNAGLAELTKAQRLAVRRASLTAADSLGGGPRGHKEGPGKLVKRGGKEIHMEAKSQEKTHVDRWAELSAAEREAAEANYEAMGEKARARADEARREKGLAPRDRSGQVARQCREEDGRRGQLVLVQERREWQLRWRRRPVDAVGYELRATPTASSGESAASAPPKPAAGFVPSRCGRLDA